MSAGKIIVAGVLVLWAVEIVNQFLGHRLNLFGIWPREAQGLYGVFLWPFLHGGFAHLIANTVPLAVLAWFVLLDGTEKFFIITLLVTVAGGLLVWAFAGGGVHVGASGLIFGYFGYLLSAAWYRPNWRSIAVAVLTVLMYGGIIFGILPGQPHVSWEGHLAGLVSGIAVAFLLSRPR